MLPKNLMKKSNWNCYKFAALRSLCVCSCDSRTVVTLTSAPTGQVKFWIAFKILVQKWQLLQCDSVKQGLTFNWKLRNCKLGTKSEENLVINFGQTLLSYVCTGKCTYHSVSNVPPDGNRKKRQTNYRHLHNSFVWTVSTNAALLSRDHGPLSAEKCRVSTWLECHVYSQPLE